MAKNMLIESLRDLLFGERADEWNAADDAGKTALMEECGLDGYTPGDISEAVTLMAEELPAEQAALLSPAVNNQAQSAGSSDSTTNVTGPEVTQNIGGDTNVAGGNIGDTTSQVDNSTSGASSSGAPAPTSPAPAPAAPAPADPAHAPVAPPVYEGTPAEVATQTVNYYVSNVTNNIDQSTQIDDRDTRIDNSTTLEGDIYAEGDVELEFDNDVQTAGDGAVQLGERAEINDSQIASGAGSVAAGGDIDGVITGDVADSTIVQGDVTDSAVTGDVEGVVAVDSDVAGVNTGEVGGDMVTNTGGGNAASGGSQIIDASGSSGPVNVATDGSEINDVDVDSGGDAQVQVGDANVGAQGSDAQAAGGDAIDADGNVNTGAGDQTNLEIGDISSGDDLNLNLQGTQNVQDTETNTNIVNDNDTTITTEIDTEINTDINTEINDSVVDSEIDDSVVNSEVDDSNVNSEGAAVSESGDATGINDAEINIDETLSFEAAVIVEEAPDMAVEEPAGMDPMDE